MQQLAAEGRQATAQEQAVLVRYVGWGGLPQAFDHKNTEWSQQYEELNGLLSPDEYEAARRSTQDAHYTATPVIDAIYSGLERVGFQGGRVLEPSIGTGNFVGKMPVSMKANAEITGIELDPTTSRIAKHLYPTASIINKGFQEVNIPSGYFDLAIGNPPFGSQKLYDARHNELNDFSIHNFFIAKSLDKVREGGITAVVVSNYFMDAQNPAAREFIADRAHFLGAVRLPNNAFKKNALTEVTTDIVFLKKAKIGETPDRAWVNVGKVTDRETGNDIPLNDYFIANPHMMLGEMTLTGTMYRDGSAALVAPEGQDIALELSKAIEFLPEGIYQAIERNEETQEKPEIIIPDDIKIGAFFVTEEGKLARRLPDILDKHNYEFVTAKNEKAEERIKGMIEIRSTLRQLMLAEQSEDTPEEALSSQRQELNRVYDRFVKKHGHISSQTNKSAMSDDPDYPLLMSLEWDYDKGVSKETAKKNGTEARSPSAQKAAIFEKRVTTPFRHITHVETAKEALVVSMNELGRVDLNRMIRLTSLNQDQIIRDLDGLIYETPEGRWETAEIYLSGNVKAKLKDAERAAEANPKYAANVEALKQVIPADIEPVDISIGLGATWVPEKVVSDFVTHLVGTVSRNISYQPALGKWIAQIGRGDETTMKVTWGTADMPANILIANILANKAIEVKDEIGRDDYNNPIYKLNEAKTAAANQKADEIKQAFQDWVWEEKDRRELLSRIYNDNFNTNVPTKYDGSHLTLPGSSVTVQLRPHQKDAIWRGIQDGSALFDHVVGAGKTFEVIATAMESKRMGLLNKSMVVVPNHLLLQWKDDFYRLYPNAKILVAEKSDFQKENRQKLFAKIATGDWDAVIIGHSSFKKIGMPQETLHEILTEQIDDLTDAILKMKADRGDRITIKEMEKSRDRMKAKLERAAETGEKDKVVTFSDLGLDGLFVDEIHEYKNLFINTSMNRISGLGNLAGSDKAFDLFVKARHIQKTNNNRGFFGATGTPISNTIAECYTMQRYFQYDELKLRGIVHFDAWASTFGSVVTGWELDATGVNYKINSRFAKFQNVPELTGMYRSFADVITMSDLQRQAAERGERFPVPKLKGGKPINVIVKRSELQARFMGVQEPVLDEEGKPRINDDGIIIKNWNPGSIIHRMENLPDDPSEDNPLKITNEARKAGLDYRLIDPSAPDFAGSKVNIAVENAFATWEKRSEQRGTQLIFCDLSTPKSAKTERLFLYHVRKGDEVFPVSGKPVLRGLIRNDEENRVLFTYQDGQWWNVAERETGKIIGFGHTEEEAISGAKAYLLPFGSANEALQHFKLQPAITDEEREHANQTKERLAAAAPLDAPDEVPAIEGEQPETEEDSTISMDDLLAGNTRFSVYDDIKQKLIAKGVPENEIRFIHEAKTDLQKARLFDEMNRGEVRILLGSTAKMGAGTNVQRRLVAEHHLDAPWRPSDLEQREGRIIRQGNIFYEQNPDGFEVEIYRYATEQTYDSRMWQVIEYKASGIEQFRKGDALQRVIDDVASEASNAAEMKAAATGNPLIFMQVQLSADLKKLEAVANNHKRNKHALESRVAFLEKADERADERIAKVDKNIALRDANKAPLLKIAGKVYSTEDEEGKKALQTAMLGQVKKAIDQKTKAVYEKPRPVNFGEFRGFAIQVYARQDHIQFVVVGPDYTYEPSNLSYGKNDKLSGPGLITRLDHFMATFEQDITDANNARTRQLAELEKARIEVEKPFAQQQELEMLRRDVGEVIAELKKMQADANYVSTWQPASRATESAKQPETQQPAEPQAEQQELQQETANITTPAFVKDEAAQHGVPDYQPKPQQPIRDAAKIAAEKGLSPININLGAGRYAGPVVEVTETHIVQDIGRKEAVLHPRNRIAGYQQCRPGDRVFIEYANGQATLKNRTEERALATSR